MQTNNEPVPASPADAGMSMPPIRRSFGRTLWPALAASVLLVVITGAVMHRGAVLNGGQMTYSIDDTYMHMAIAKNLARGGAWGFSIFDGFNSSDSSLLWPWLLAACDAVFGDRQIMSLLLNLAACTAALFYAGSMLRRSGIVGWRSFLVLASIVIFVPLPAMVSTGMEHSVQILITLAFVDVAASLLADDAGPGIGNKARSISLLVLGSLVTTIRYEGLFLVGIVGLMLLCRRRWSLAVLLGVSAGVPLVWFGWYSMTKGWYPLPNSVLIKGNTSVVLTPTGVLLYVTTGLRRLLSKPHLLIAFLWPAAAWIVEWRRQRTVWTRLMLLLTMTLGVMALHLQFADTGWFYRYEAYLMVLSVLTVGLWAARVLSTEKWAVIRGPAMGRSGYALVAILALGSSAVLAWRCERGLAEVPIACHNIFEQQYQMGRFLHEFYNGKGVGANDVGAIDYLADIRLVDTYGLANLDVLRARRTHTYDHTVIERLLKQRGVRVLILYDGWPLMYGGALPTWTPVGEWTIPNNIICGSNTVIFYAPDPALVPELMHALQEFAPRLPGDIQQKGLYCGDRPSHVIGTYNQTLSNERPGYQAAYSASFFVYPLEGQPDSMEREATLHFNVQPAGQDLRMEVLINDRIVDTKDLTAAGPGAPGWMPWTVPTKLHGGLNSIRLVGHGTPVQEGAVNAVGERGPLLFSVGEPKWTLAGASQ